MSREEIATYDGFCSKSRYIPHRPGHATEECDKAINAIHGDRMLMPTHLVLGFETYMNLCLDVFQAENRLKRAHVTLDRAPRLTDYKNILILVDDSLCWGVTVIPPVGKAWPQYGKDDHYERRNASAEPLEPQPGDH
jgi:hypothetical protein